MKKILLSIALLTLIGMMSVNAQSTLIISENFQLWEPTEDINDTICSAGVQLEWGITRELTLTTSTGTAEIPVYLYKCGIAPECESRRVEGANPPGSIANLPGVTTGWVLLNKLTDGDPTNDPDIPITIETMDESPDTIGEFIFGPVPQIDSIVFAHSATGSQRGVRIYKSTNGVDWENASPADEFWDGADSQLGDVNTVVIDETDVYIKFTSGFKSDQTSQYTRLHNIDVYGVPGVLSSIKDKTRENMLSIYPVPAKNYVIIELAEMVVNSELQIINALGKTVYSSVVEQQTSRIDISHLNSGMYFIQIIQNDKKYVKQLVVN